MKLFFALFAGEDRLRPLNHRHGNCVKSGAHVLHIMEQGDFLIVMHLRNKVENRGCVFKPDLRRGKTQDVLGYRTRDSVSSLDIHGFDYFDCCRVS